MIWLVLAVGLVAFAIGAYTRWYFASPMEKVAMRRGVRALLHLHFPSRERGNWDA
jgi:hypothetical protein